ncbi:hypothetical protein HK102_013678 [Quaeritorhiza haematococci]|nr:hypothetical protein HK102_013678 [Quaeritorhiza haematococci]
MKLYLASLALSALSIEVVKGWGATGHQITGYIAQKFLNKNALAQIGELLDPEYNGNLQKATLWADQIRNSAGNAWTKPLHYVSTSDKPPKSCGLDAENDCADGNCILGAITNFTSQLRCSSDASEAERRDALKFLAHFLGDITQPLHVCGRERGGNGAKGRFGRSSNANLHSIWDTNIPEKRMKDSFENSLPTYASFLVSALKTGGKYASLKSTWTRGDSITQLSSAASSSRASVKLLEAPIRWASDSNGFSCTTVWPSYDQNPTQDLSGEYFDRAAEVVDLQLAKGGWRLAQWLNSIFDECAGKKDNAEAAESAVEAAEGEVEEVFTRRVRRRYRF